MVPDFYKNTLGSSIVYCLVPLIKLDITNHDTYLKMLGFNLVCTFIASLFFWEVYDFDSWLWTLDSYIARAFGINCFINNVIHLTSYHSCFFSAAPIFLYSLGFLTKDKEDYKSTLLLHILFLELQQKELINSVMTIILPIMRYLALLVIEVFQSLFARLLIMLFAMVYLVIEFLRMEILLISTSPQY